MALLGLGVQAQGMAPDPTVICVEGTGNPGLDVHYCSAAIESSGLVGRSLATLHGLRGRAKIGLGRFDAAIADFDRALRGNPLSAMARNGRGMARHGLGTYAKAIAEFDAALRLFPNYREAYRNRGTARFYLGQFEAAIDDYDKALGVTLPNPAILVLKGLAQYFRDDGASALDNLEAARDFEHPYQYLDLWIYLARLRSGLGSSAKLGQAAAALTDGLWPKSLFRYFLAEASADEVFSSIAASPANAFRSNWRN